MSLLLKALSRAEQTRRDARKTTAPQELARIEPVEPQPEPKRISDDYRPAEAASLLAAGSEPKASIVDFIQDHAFGMIVGLLLLIMAGWWTYVYLAMQSAMPFSALKSPASAALAAPAGKPTLPPARVVRSARFTDDRDPTQSMATSTPPRRKGCPRSGESRYARVDLRSAVTASPGLMTSAAPSPAARSR